MSRAKRIFVIADFKDEVERAKLKMRMEEIIKSFLERTTILDTNPDWVFKVKDDIIRVRAAEL